MLISRSFSAKEITILLDLEADGIRSNRYWRSMEAILEALDRESLEILYKALRKPEVFQRFVRAKYLPRPESECQSLHPDSQEASEAAIVDKNRMMAATWTWRRLSEQQRTVVLEVTEKLRPGDYGRLEEEMTLWVS